jgi:hypothetical protein
MGPRCLTGRRNGARGNGAIHALLRGEVERELSSFAAKISGLPPLDVGYPFGDRHLRRGSDRMPNIRAQAVEAFRSSLPTREG